MINSQPESEHEHTGQPNDMSNCAFSPASFSPALLGLAPAALWHEFDRISKIPRGSGNEDGVREYLRQFAQEHGFEFKEDIRYDKDGKPAGAGNLVIYVPGKGSGISAEPVVLQAHMDMVPVAAKGVDHDFTKDPIELQRTVRVIDDVERDVIAAVGTTLGADNGMGLSAALAAAVSDDIEDHPPLELLFTFDEERGLVGATSLDPSLISARRLLNMDSEDLGEIYISCAGGRDMISSWQIIRQTPDDTQQPVKIELKGLPGGHSGVEIHDRRGNAIQMLIQAISDPSVGIADAQLAKIEGGEARNGIPGKAEVVLWLSAKEIENLQARLHSELITEKLNRRVGEQHRNFAFEVTELDPAATSNPISFGDTRQILDAILALPDGVQNFSTVKPDLVETSNNVAVIKTTDDRIDLACLTRSSKPGAVEALQEIAAKGLTDSGATVEFSNSYTGWEAEPNNPLLVTAQARFEAILGEPVKIKAIHAGLECGPLKGKFPDMQIISFGPTIKGAHTPEECVIIETVDKFWGCLKGLLGDLSLEQP